jgi:paraquat-inducible protein B
MSNPQEPAPSVPESKVVQKKRFHFSFIWIVPIVAATVGIWIGVTTIHNQGPTLTITFRSADGLEANKTQIRYHGIVVGMITSLRLAEDHQSVVATAKMDPKTENFFVKDTAFWVVRPQISGANISGLSTLISGAYIGMEIGKSNESESDFTAVEDAPMETEGVRGRYYLLKTPQLGSLNKGTPIYFRRLQAGQVVSYELDKSGDFLNVKIFIQEPYDEFVTTNTRFWQASGLNVSLSANGLQVQTESLLSILIGGIAFETADEDSQLPPARDGAPFNLFSDRADAFSPPPVNPQSYVVVFKESIRGLEIGDPVEFEGIPIGKVKDFQAQFDAQTFQFSVPVTIEVDPRRFGIKFVDLPPGQTVDSIRKKFLDSLVARGLRAQLQTGSLITGSRFIALDVFPNAPRATMNWSQDPPQLPVMPGEMAAMGENLAGIIRKINDMPFKDIGDNLNKTLLGAQATLTNANGLLINANNVIGPNSVLDAQLGSMINQLGGAAQAISLLADYLERHPEALIRGKTDQSK